MRGRAEWFLSTRRDAEGKVLEGVHARAVAARRRAERRDARPGDELPGAVPGPPGSVNWTPLGPSVLAQGSGQNIGVSGRINAIVAGPAGMRVYAGAANGGVWFSSDGGASWIPLDDYSSSPSFISSVEADSLSVGAVAVRFGPSAATDDVYVGTGEPTFNSDRYLGIGIRHSPSGGAPGTWSLEGTNLAGRGVYAITIDPDDPSIVLAATIVGLFRRPATTPFTTWAQVTSPAFTSANVSAHAIVVAGTGAAKRYYLALGDGSVYRSADATTWTALTGVAGTGRTVLGVAPSDPTIAYLFREDATLARLVGTGFQPVTGLPASAVLPGGQGWYDLAIAVNPADPNTIIVGGDRPAVFKGTVSAVTGGFTFPFNAANAANPYNDPTWVGQGVHSDVHTVVHGLNSAGTGFEPSDVWVGSDGGVFRSTLAGAASSFQARNRGLAITENAYLAQRPDTDAVLFAGSQDNGTNRLVGEEAAVEVAGGDGGGVAVDQNNPYRVMRQYVRAGLEASTTGDPGSFNAFSFPPVTASTTAQRSAADTENSQTAFVAPIASSPAGVSPSLVAFGTQRLWLSADWGTTWVTLPTGTNPYAQATPDLNQDTIDTFAIVAVEFASATRIYAATALKVCRYDQAGAAWTRTTLPSMGLPSFRPITDLDVADAAAGTLYATLGGGGAGIAHLYYFDGTSWSAALPTTVVDVPAHAVAVDPDNPQTVYVGTDVGCWQGTKTAASTWTWTVFSPGLPEAAIVDLGIHRRARLLRASTHGRGLWEIELDAASGLTPELYLRVNDADTGRTPGGSRFAWVEGAADPLRQGRTVYHWMSADIKVRRPSLSGLPPLPSSPDFLDFTVNVGDYVDATNIETADATGVNRILVEVHNRALTPLPAAQVQVCLLVTDAYAGLPPLPSGYAAHINAGDTASSWLSGTQWRFADPSSPYRTLPRDLDVRTPGVVEFDVDFTSLSLPLGHDHVCAAAFVTSASDAIGSTDTNLDQLTMHDRHVAHRNLHLVAAGATPSAKKGGRSFDQDPQTFLLRFHNPDDIDTIDVVFELAEFPGRLGVMLPKQITRRLGGAASFEGFTVEQNDGPTQRLERHVGHWLERLGETIEKIGESLAHDLGDDLPRGDDGTHERARRALAALDRERTFVATRAAAQVTMRGVPLRKGATFTGAITVVAPADARPGDSFGFDVIQRQGDRVVGGSTYQVVVADARNLRRRFVPGGAVGAW